MAKTATTTKEKPAAPPPADPKPASQPQAQPPAQGTPPAKTEKPKHPIVLFKEYMDQRMNELQFALPPHISPERFGRVVLTALQRKPELLKCTRQSLFNACLLAAHDGLLPDGREGAIAPYGENQDGQRVAEIATWMPMIEGLRKKARNSGEISDWMAHVVRARDRFAYRLGDEPFIEHEPYFGPEEPGEVVGAYSIAIMKDGTKSRDVMTIRDIEKIRAKSKAKKGPWGDPTFFPEMCKKTVARRHYKQLPHSSDLDEIIRRDDEAFGLDDRAEDQIEQRQAKRITSVSAAFQQFAGDGPVIDHEPTGGNAGDAKPAGDKQAQQPGASEQETGEGAGEAKGDAGEAKAGEKDGAKTEGQNAEPAQEGAAEAKTNADDAPQWPADKVPANKDDYETYVAFTAAAATNPDDLSAWFKSDAERKLRNSCGVDKEGFDAAQAIVRDRATKLRGK
jgi:recombination protein RecT